MRDYRKEVFEMQDFPENVPEMQFETAEKLSATR